MPDSFVHGAASPSTEPGARQEAATRVLVVDADPALFGLIAEWLGAAGYAVVPPNGEYAGEHAGLVIVDVPFPRHGGASRLKRLAQEYPDTPILVLSSTFFTGIGNSGDVARSLGVAGVLAKPLARDALIAATRALLRPPVR